MAKPCIVPRWMQMEYFDYIHIIWINMVIDRYNDRFLLTTIMLPLACVAQTRIANL